MNDTFFKQCVAVQARRHEHDEEQAMLLIGLGFIKMAAKDEIQLLNYSDWRN